MGQVSLLEVQAAEAALVAQTARMEAHRKEMRLLLETVAQEELTAVAVGIEVLYRGNCQEETQRRNLYLQL